MERIAGRRVRRRRRPGCPARCWCPTMPADAEAVAAYLTDAPGRPGGRAGAGAGAEAGPAPDGGAERRRGLRPPPAAPTSDHNSRARALESLQRELRLPVAPLRIECYDMSHLQGTDYVGLDGGLRGRAAQEERLPPLPGGDRARQRRLCRHGGGADPAADLPPGRRRGAPAPPGARRSRRRSAPGPRPGGVSPIRPSCCSSTGGWASSTSGIRVLESTGADRAGADRRAGQELRGGLPAGQLRSPSACPASPRRSTCSSGSGTRPTASPSPTTAPCGASG